MVRTSKKKTLLLGVNSTTIYGKTKQSHFFVYDLLFIDSTSLSLLLQRDKDERETTEAKEKILFSRRYWMMHNHSFLFLLRFFSISV